MECDSETMKPSGTLGVGVRLCIYIDLLCHNVLADCRCSHCQAVLPTLGSVMVTGSPFMSGAWRTSRAGVKSRIALQSGRRCETRVYFA